MGRPHSWLPIETAPKDGTRFKGKLLSSEIVNGSRPRSIRITWWGKTSHVPLYGWCHGRGENVDLWYPTHWSPLLAHPTQEGEADG